MTTGNRSSVISISHGSTGRRLAVRVELANTFLKRLRGLMFRRRLAPDEGLWLRPCNGVHTFWMLFAIDVIFLDRDLKIVRLVENLRPFRVTKPHLSARSVIEMPAHTISSFGLKVGDSLVVERTERI